MKPILWPLLALFVVCSFSCSTDEIDDKYSNTTVSTYVPETKPIEIEILELINIHRQNLNLNKLESLSIIKSEAFSHTDFMIENNEVSHANFYARKENLINNAGAIEVGENIAYAFSSPQSVVNAWLNSDGHREMIEGDFTNFDISAEQNEDGKWFFTNIFIKK